MSDRGGRRRGGNNIARPDRSHGDYSYSSGNVREPGLRSAYDGRRQGDDRRLYALEDYSSASLRSGGGDSRSNDFEGPGSALFPTSFSTDGRYGNYYDGYALVKGEDEQTPDSRYPAIEDEPLETAASFTAADREFMEQWLEAADNGELDIYTCLALSDMSTWSLDTRDLVLSIICVMMVQGLIPFIMLRTELRNSKDDELPEMEYRVCGFIIYLYSVWMIYKGSTDDCRTLVLDRGIQCGVPMHFLMPAVFGEVMNAIVGCALTTSLFVIFTSSSDMTNLVMNAVAINFLSTVDSEFVELDHKKLAKRNISVITEGWATHQSWCRHLVTHCLQVTLEILRITGIILLGVVFALIFLCAHEPWLCDRWNLAPYLAPVGLCDAPLDSDSASNDTLMA